VDKKWAITINFLFDSVKKGYIVDFSIECNKSFNGVERKFVASPKGGLLEEIPLWIKMLFLEKGMKHMELDRMVE
jgi:hypothetical protein